VDDVQFPLLWRKARASANGGGNCVEVAPAGRTVLVRNSRDPEGAVLAFAVAQWDAFVTAARGGAADSRRDPSE
jgi:Domain of unknown function (DUF397)